jgi:hypothetical protein
MIVEADSIVLGIVWRQLRQSAPWMMDRPWRSGSCAFAFSPITLNARARLAKDHNLCIDKIRLRLHCTPYPRNSSAIPAWDFVAAAMSLFPASASPFLSLAIPRPYNELASPPSKND